MLKDLPLAVVCLHHCWSCDKLGTALIKLVVCHIFARKIYGNSEHKDQEKFDACNGWNLYNGEHFFIQVIESTDFGHFTFSFKCLAF